MQTMNWSLLHSPFSSLLCPNIHLRILFSSHHTHELFPTCQWHQLVTSSIWVRECLVLSLDFHCKGQTITKENYRDVLCCLREAAWHKRPELWSRGNWRLHHNNAPAHSSHWFRLFWKKTTLLWFARLLILLIWLPATFGCSPNPNSRGHWKVRYFSNRPRTSVISASMIVIFLPVPQVSDYLLW